jgi:hypothetical protein
MPSRASLMSRKLLWIGAALAIGLGLVWQYYPLTSPGLDRMAQIPLSGATFQGKDVPLTETEKLVFGQVDMVNRRYLFGGRDLFVSVVDGTKDRHAVHDPRYCFQGAGWRLLSETPFAVPGGMGRRLKLARGQDRFETYFWFADGSGRYASFPRYWWQTTLRRFTLGKWGAEPVLVVVQDLYPARNGTALAVPELIQALRL